jgi:hypothetical protein
MQVCAQPLCAMPFEVFPGQIGQTNENRLAQEEFLTEANKENKTEIMDKKIGEKAEPFVPFASFCSSPIWPVARFSAAEQKQKQPETLATFVALADQRNYN